MNLSPKAFLFLPPATSNGTTMKTHGSTVRSEAALFFKGAEPCLVVGQPVRVREKGETGPHWNFPP